MNARAELPLHAPGTQVDKGYIGQSVPRPNAKRLLQGRGTFVDDLRFPRLAHVVFFRSPYAHAKLKRLDLAPAARHPHHLAADQDPGGADGENCQSDRGAFGTGSADDRGEAAVPASIPADQPVHRRRMLVGPVLPSANRDRMSLRAAALLLSTDARGRRRN